MGRTILVLVALLGAFAFANAGQLNDVAATKPASDKPATQPADLVAELAAAKQRIAQLEKENAALREKLALSDPKPDKVATATKTVDIKTCAQILDEIPKDQRPAAGEPWDGIGLQLACDWVAKNIPGRTFNGKLTYTISVATRPADGSAPGVEGVFSDPSLGKLSSANITAKFDKNTVQYFRTLKNGATVHVRGTIKHVTIGNNGRYPISAVLIEDATVVK